MSRYIARPLCGSMSRHFSTSGAQPRGQVIWRTMAPVGVALGVDALGVVADDGVGDAGGGGVEEPGVDRLLVDGGIELARGQRGGEGQGHDRDTPHRSIRQNRGRRVKAGAAP
jgi:hypothetical protein